MNIDTDLSYCNLCYIYMNIDTNLRYCNLCYAKGTFVIKTEFHFLLEYGTSEDLWLSNFEQDMLRFRNI